MQDRRIIRVRGREEGEKGGRRREERRGGGEG
jgi:hypothetical protein